VTTNAGSTFLIQTSIDERVRWIVFINDCMEKIEGACFIISESEKLAELVKSRDNHFVLGIVSSALGQGVQLCYVQNIWRDEDEEDVIIVLKEISVMDHQVVYLHEIERIYSFATQQAASGPHPVFRMNGRDHG
jgi:hypothetical protein